MNNHLGVEIRGNFVSFAELRSDVAAAYRKGLGGTFAFMPETVEALLEYIATQQIIQTDDAEIDHVSDETKEANAIRENCNPLFFTNR